MKKFHLRATGEPAVCKAEKGKCPYGGKSEHYESKHEAREAYEKSMTTVKVRQPSKMELLQSRRLDELVSNLGKKGRGVGAGTLDDPINVKGDVMLAARLISEGKHVRLNKTHEVGTLLTDLRAMVLECEQLGKAAPTFDLCKVSVPKTNLFCASNKGYARVTMPQLTGFAEEGSLADTLPKRDNGKVDIAAGFKKELQARGVKVERRTVRASSLKASQAELDGPKIARKVAKARAGKLEDKVIFVTKDNYVLDGHHFWATKVAFGTEKNFDPKLQVEVIDMEIGEAIPLANDFAKMMGIQAKDLGAAA